MTADESLGKPLLIQWFRVTMGDTDAAQVIYFGAPTRWAERLITEWMAEAGIPTSALIAAGFGMPVVHVELSYRHALRLDERVRGELRVRRVSRRSLTWACRFLTEQEQVAVEVLVTQAYVRIDAAGSQAETLPAELVDKLRPAGTAADVSGILHKRKDPS
jgi:acyl-CoA thioester hydrolase